MHPIFIFYSCIVFLSLSIFLKHQKERHSYTTKILKYYIVMCINNIKGNIIETNLIN